jgi:recombination protein RecA
MSNEKAAILDNTIKKIEKQFGKGSIMKMGEKTSIHIDSMPTGCLSLDMAIGVGGLPKGRIIEIYGPESSGKTTFTLGFIASCQRAGGTAAFIDAEHALDPVYARNLGVDVDNLLISQPDYGEQALEIVDDLVSSGAVDLIVVDSVAALVPKSELDGDMDQQVVGAHARLMSKGLRKITGSVSKTKCIVVFINQIRMKIGVMFGNPETTTGGNALKFYSSVRMEVRKAKTISINENPIGAETKVKIVKNKVSAPFREIMVDLIYGKGIQKESELINLAEQVGILEKAGSWYSYKNERIAQGKENLKNYMQDHQDFVKKIEKEIRERAGNVKLEIKDTQNSENKAEPTVNKA